jgi:3-methyl-2-oxobutanoate hydroxymethyltransferase
MHSHVNDKISTLQQMKRDGRKIVAAVVYDYQLAQIVDRAGVDIVSVGDSVGTVLWGLASDGDLTTEQMLLACRAVRRGVSHALVSCDLPERADPMTAARHAVEVGGADLVKVEAGAEVIRAIVAQGIPVWAQLSNASTAVDDLVARAQALQAAGASLIDFRHSGPVAGTAVVQAVPIPVIGGLGGGPWLDGRVRAMGNAIGYTAAALDDNADRYANVAQVTFDAVTAYADDVRSGRQIRGR